MSLVALIKQLYDCPLVSHLFHTLVYCLKQELQGCDSVLDLGCGPDSPVKYAEVPRRVGVEAFEPYLAASKNLGTHTEYIQEDLTKVAFEARSFDAVLLIDVLEHLDKGPGAALLAKAEVWARRKVIVSTPNGFVPQPTIDRNPFQAHRSGWSVEEIKRRGYRVYGMAGWKFLRRANVSEKVAQADDIYTTIRFRPRPLWLVISELTQLAAYFFPKLAFEFFAVKDLEDKS